MTTPVLIFHPGGNKPIKVTTKSGIEKILYSHQSFVGYVHDSEAFLIEEVQPSNEDKLA